MTRSSTPSAHEAHQARTGPLLFLVLVSYLMIIVDTSVVITGLPDIQADLGLSATALSWVQSAYTLAFGGLLLLGARAGDVFGRRRVLITGLGLFSTASLVVGLAPTGGALIAARALQGVGAAILAPATLALLTAGFPEGPARARAVAAYGSVAGIGTAFGLVLGGLLADLASWRIAFAVNVPMGALLVVLALKALPGGAGRQSGRLDVVGAVTSTLGMTALVHGIVRSADSGWDDPMTLVSCAVGVVLVAVFVLVERSSRWNRGAPIMPLHLLADRRRTGAYLARFCFIGSMITYFLFVSQFLQDVQGWSALAAGLSFLPMTLVNFVVAVRVQQLTARFGAGRLLGTGMGLAFAGLLLLTRLQEDSSYALSIGAPGLLIGAGQGLVFAHLTAAGVAGVRPEEAGAASGVVNAFHQLGSAVGLGITVAVAAAVVQDSTGTPATVMTTRVVVALAGSAVLMGIALLLTLLLVVPDRGAGRTAAVVPGPAHEHDAPVAATTPSNVTTSSNL